jgi:hypothetical protein
LALFQLWDLHQFYLDCTPKVRQMIF